MGKAGRVFCIATPMALTIASLVCLALVFLGNTNKNSTLSDFYFWKADTSNFDVSPTVNGIKGTTLDDKLIAEINAALKGNGTGQLKDFYTVGLWNYCDGTSSAKQTNTGVATSNFNSTTQKIEYCSPKQSSYYFNPMTVFGLDSAMYEKFPKELKDGINVYSKVVKFMFAVYVVAISTTAAEILVGILAIFSRWGSCVTTIVSTVSTISTFLASLTATILYSTLTGTFNTVLKPYNVHASLGARMLTTTWLAFAFSLGAGLFWSISTCCCSGHSDRKQKAKAPSSGNRWFGRGKGVTAEKAPYSYEPVHSPFAGGEQVPLHNMGAPMGHSGRENAYEPFRSRV